MKLSTIRREGIKIVNPTKTRLAKESYATLDKEIQQIMANIITFSKTVSQEEKRKTIFPEDISRGTKRYLESFNPDYLPQLQLVVNDWFNKKALEAKEYANKRIY
jgi:histone H3/H4